MADLPDIDTTQVSFIAFWNAIDQGGVSDIDPSEVTSEGNIATHTVHDNGIEGTYNSLTGRTINFRVKEDGWLVAWTDRTEDFALEQQSPDNVRGIWDLINDWTDPTAEGAIDTNTLERAIESLADEFSNFGSMTYNTADVGLYNYAYADATTVSHLSDARSSSGGGSHDVTVEFSYTSSTNLLFAAAIGAIDAHAESGGFSTDNTESSFEGTNLAFFASIDPGARDQEYGAVDAIAQGLIPNAATAYGHRLRTDTNSGNGFGRTVGDVLILWN